MKTQVSRILVFGIVVLSGCAPTHIVRVEPERVATMADVLSRAKIVLTDAIAKQALPVRISPLARVDTLLADSAQKTLRVMFSREMSFRPFREETVRTLYDTVRGLLGERFRGFSLSIETTGHRIEELVPNMYRVSEQIDSTRLARPDTGVRVPVVRRVSRPFTPTAGLYGRNIVLSPSHGWMYSKERDRWEWQRPRLYQSVEDLIPMSFVVQYLMPMLENAGAMVFVPRERDTQTHEVIVDNDGLRGRRAAGRYQERNSGRLRWKNGPGSGFAPLGHLFVSNENTFVLGSYRRRPADTLGTANIRWTPDIPEDGEYYVSVTYPAGDSNVTDAHYTVYHTGGATEFLVNQRIGGSTWEYLGRFRFKAGMHPPTGSVVLTSKSITPSSFVCADGIRFGGGMGMILRNGRASDRPLFTLGARYYLQYIGMPDTLVYTVTNNRDDYRDDFMSRPEYANYLRGAPFGPWKDRKSPGLGIPIDLSYSFHTDAGIAPGESTIGTLAIYTSQSPDSQSVFPDSVSRMANRDLADVVQSQIVRDLRALDDSGWSRRDLWDAKYQEAFRPNMPSVLVELLSHQNFSDMRHVQDPVFRFDVSRAIYKGVLRFLAGQHGFQPVVQPLPVTHMCATISGEREVTLQWKPGLDSLEPSARPLRYMVYIRMEDGEFDNGRVADQPSLTVPNLLYGVLYSFKVTGVNEGGESFPSEILSVCLQKRPRDTVLVINGFTRVGPPAWVESKGFSGFMSSLDAGVPYHHDFSFTGAQYDYDPSSEYRTNDGPGHGNSRADHEGEVVAGNTFDYVSVHGNALRSCGYSFLSAGVDAIIDSMVQLRKFRTVDLILGKQRRTHNGSIVIDSTAKANIRFETFPPSLRSMLRDYAYEGGAMLISGSYVGTDLFQRTPFDSAAAMFATDILHYGWATGHASSNGIVQPVDSTFRVPDSVFHFTTVATHDTYGIDSPDAIDPIGGGKTLLRYAEDRFSAGVGYRGSYRLVTLGFPFESVIPAPARAMLMNRILTYLHR